MLRGMISIPFQTQLLNGAVALGFISKEQAAGDLSILTPKQQSAVDALKASALKNQTIKQATTTAQTTTSTVQTIAGKETLPSLAGYVAGFLKSNVNKKSEPVAQSMPGA